jgi:hypothetical protein
MNRAGPALAHCLPYSIFHDQTRLGIVLFACVTTLALTACAASPPCSQPVHAIESTVHTGGLWTNIALPNVDSLATVHWIGRPRSSACSREVGPTDWWYQAVVPLTKG